MRVHVALVPDDAARRRGGDQIGDDMGARVSGCTCALAGGPHPALPDLLSYSPGRGTRTATWKTARLSATQASDLDTAACIVADLAVAARSVGTAYVYNSWSNAIATRTKLPPDDAELIGTYIDHAFGLPHKSRDERHRRGWLAEFLFSLLAERIGTRTDRNLLHVEGPDWHATKPGRDSLVIWERSDGVVEFRLWESKQSVGSTPVSSSVTEATTQLRTSALSYLAQATSIAAAAGAQSGPKVRAIYADLARLWAVGSPQAGIGISVTTTEAKIPGRCFSRVSRSFPRLSSPSQIEGLVAGVADFAVFADVVRDRVWTPL